VVHTPDRPVAVHVLLCRRPSVVTATHQSAGHVLGEMARVSELFPSVQEVFFDDDTFTDDRRRADRSPAAMGKLA